MALPASQRTAGSCLRLVLVLGQRQRRLPLRFWGWPRGVRFGFPRGTDETLDELLPMASGSRGPAGRGSSGRGVQECGGERAPRRGPCPAGSGGCGRAAGLLSPPRAPGRRRVLPAAGSCPHRVPRPGGYLPPMPHGRAPGCALAPAGARTPARCSWAIESGPRRREADWVPARGDGDVRGSRPRAEAHGAGAGCRAPPRGLVSGPLLPAPARRRQDSLAPVAMVTAAPVNESLNDTRAPARPDVVPGRAAFPAGSGPGWRGPAWGWD